MNGKKGGRLLPLILVIVDVLLAVVIVNAYNKSKTPENVSTNGSAYFSLHEDIPTKDESDEPRETTEEAASAKPSYDTDERPSMDDFLGWYTSDVMPNGVPDGVTRITELSDILGGWKGIIYYDPENTEGSKSVELLNFRIGEGQYGLTLTADWYMMSWDADGFTENEEDMEDFDFPASWENGQLKGDRDSVIIFTDFYEKDGKQYACGYMETASGIPAKAAMVRP